MKRAGNWSATATSNTIGNNSLNHPSFAGGEIVGQTTTEELLDSNFSTFCIKK